MLVLNQNVMIGVEESAEAPLQAHASISIHNAYKLHSQDNAQHHIHILV